MVLGRSASELMCFRKCPIISELSRKLHIPRWAAFFGMIGSFCTAKPLSTSLAGSSHYTSDPADLSLPFLISQPADLNPQFLEIQPGWA